MNDATPLTPVLKCWLLYYLQHREKTILIFSLTAISYLPNFHISANDSMSSFFLKQVLVDQQSWCETVLHNIILLVLTYLFEYLKPQLTTNEPF